MMEAGQDDWNRSSQLLLASFPCIYTEMEDMLRI
jgi:hypothetical protein